MEGSPAKALERLDLLIARSRKSILRDSVNVKELKTSNFPAIMWAFYAHDNDRILNAEITRLKTMDAMSWGRACDIDLKLKELEQAKRAVTFYLGSSPSTQQLLHTDTLLPDDDRPVEEQRDEMVQDMFSALRSDISAARIVMLNMFIIRAADLERHRALSDISCEEYLQFKREIAPLMREVRHFVYEEIGNRRTPFINKNVEEVLEVVTTLKHIYDRMTALLSFGYYADAKDDGGETHSEKIQIIMALESFEREDLHISDMREFTDGSWTHLLQFEKAFQLLDSYSTSYVLSVLEELKADFAPGRREIERIDLLIATAPYLLDTAVEVHAIFKKKWNAWAKANPGHTETERQRCLLAQD
jgi:hypothetical protein